MRDDRRTSPVYPRRQTLPFAAFEMLVSDSPVPFPAGTHALHHHGTPKQGGSTYREAYESY